MNVYDFDKTIYDGDSSFDFYFFNLRRKWRLVLYWPVQIWAALCYQCKLITKTEMKTEFYRYFRALEDIDQEVSLFWEKHQHKIKCWYLKQKKPTDVIVSASPEFFLKPICDHLNVVLIASDVDKKTGKNLRANCYGEEKVKRFSQHFRLDEIDDFYSDSISDAPLARYAKRAYLVKGDDCHPWQVN